MSVLLAFLQSVLDIAYHQMLIPLCHSLSEPSVASSHGVRCLSSEHAVIAKEQTAQAIANTAHAYERGGVEAALNEVRTSMAPAASQNCHRSPPFHYSVSLLRLTTPSLFLLFSLTLSPHPAATASGS